MGVYRIIECDVCKKKEEFDAPYREKWFMENICHTICSEECWKKSTEEAKKG